MQWIVAHEPFHFCNLFWAALLLLNGILVVEDLKEMKDLWKFLKRMKEAISPLVVLV